MKFVNVNEFINSLNISVPSVEEFKKLCDSTSMYFDENNKIIKGNYEREVLLYALVAKYRPKNIIEFGTACGYGSLCMAKAIQDFNIQGNIFTIDMNDPKHPHVFPADFNDGEGIKTRKISVENLWKKIVPRECINKIKLLNGYSGEIMNSQEFPKMDFAYIDGAHFYDGVKHDFFSFLNIRAKEFHILFDDYRDSPHFGIKKLIDNDIGNNCEPVLIDTDLEKIALKLGLTKDSIYGMCLIDSKSFKDTIENLFPKKKRNDFLKKYRAYEKRLKFRSKINEKIPLLKNIRFRWWKK
jgi:hypothetical protein